MTTFTKVKESVPVMCFSTEPEVLAEYLFTYARDWPEVLVFFENYCKSVGMPLDSRRVSEIIVELFGE